MNKKCANRKTVATTYRLLQSPLANYLVVIVDRGMTSEVNHFNSLKEAKRAFKEIAYNHGYEPEEINGSDYYDVSIWKWNENRYEKVYLYI